MGGSPGSTNVTQQPQIPDEIKPLVSGSVGHVLGGQRDLPLGQFFGWQPGQVADMSNLQAFGMGQIPHLMNTEPAFTGAFNALETIPELAARPVLTPFAENAALGQLFETTGGPIGSSPATQSGMEAWRNTVLPTVQNEMGLMGLGRSGPELEAVARSQTSALTPLLQQEIENRMRSVQMLGGIADDQTARQLHPRDQTINALLQSVPMATNLGNSMFSQRMGAIDEALKGGQISRNIAQEGMDAQTQERARLQSLSEAMTLGPLGQVLPSLVGSKTNSQKDLFSAIMGKSLVLALTAQVVCRLLGIGGLSA